MRLFFTTTFPTSLDSFTNPTGGQTLNSPDHAGQHSNINDSVAALEAKVGINSSAVNTTQDYKLSGVATGDKAVSKTGTETLTNKTLTSPVVNVGSDTTGDMYYRNSGGAFTRLGIGSSLQVLAVSSGLPTWISNPAASNASTTVAGIVEEATQSEVDAYTATGGTGARLYVNPSTLSTKFRFGGTGADGALSISSGTTTIDLANAAVVIKNYTSISITSTGVLAFSNPHANGTTIILKSQGAVTITSSTVPCIDASAMGAAGGTAGLNGNEANSTLNVSSNGKVGVSAGATGAAGAVGNIIYKTSSLQMKSVILCPGAGGGAGISGGGSDFGLGGRGGGALSIECAGALNFTGTISTSGANGGNGVQTQNPGGGGGAAGTCYVIYNTLTANTGTISATGGSGGTANSGTNTNNRGGGGAGSPFFAGGAGGTGDAVGVASGGIGAGGGGGGTNSRVGGAGGSSMGGFVVANTEF